MLKTRWHRRGERRKWGVDEPSAVSVGARLTFRAELMPGRAPGERTFAVARVLPSGRVELVSIGGEHALTEFEPVQT